MDRVDIHLLSGVTQEENGTMVNMPQNSTKPNPTYLIYTYKQDKKCHKTKPNQSYISNIYV